jgi:predicted GNAT superfamily acetyltransferase
MQLRHIETADYEFIASIVDEWWGGRPVRSLLQRLFFEHFNTTSFALVEETNIVGFLIGFKSQSQPNIAYVHFVGVDPAYRGKGLARSLYLRFFDTVQLMGCNEVQCITSPVNKTSIQFHAAMGFNVIPSDDRVDGISVHRNHAGKDQPRVVFTKQLG